MSKQPVGNDYPEATRKVDRSVLGFFSIAERVLLVIISLLTMLAVALELIHFAEAGRVRLADLLLLFIYLEVIGMAYAYYATHSVPVTLPVLIAITGITRLIILQGKEAEPSKLLFEAGAVLLLALSLAILSWASQRTSMEVRCDAQLRIANDSANSSTAPASKSSLLGSASLPCKIMRRVMPVIAINTGSVTGTLWVA